MYIIKLYYNNIINYIITLYYNIQYMQTMDFNISYYTFELLSSIDYNK